jgi:hypothetical protein
MPPIVFGTITAMALAYLVVGFVIGAASVPHLIAVTFANWALLCVAILVAIRISRWKGGGRAP